LKKQDGRAKTAFPVAHAAPETPGFGFFNGLLRSRNHESPNRATSLDKAKSATNAATMEMDASTKWRSDQPIGAASDGKK
jgi:hypothetical protein